MSERMSVPRHLKREDVHAWVLLDETDSFEADAIVGESAAREPEGPSVVDGAKQPHASRVSMAFVIAFFAMVLIPLACMPFVSEDVSAEKRELAPTPSLTKDGAPNLNVLADTGDWFADHFAFRGTMVDLDATIKQRVFMTSATDNVVVGSSGWLYYAGTLNDYQRRNRLSDHELANVAANLALIQEYITAQGKGFAFAIAPNKNSLYPEHMPYYEMPGEGESNLDRLRPLLDAAGVRTCDLQAAFNAQDVILYYQRDSHWNGEGALLAYRCIAPLLSTPVTSFEGEQEMVAGHVGDVDVMLHPATAQEEQDPHWTAADMWEYANEAASVEDDMIQTHSTDSSARGTLLMYRDSFGNNLLPYFASAYAEATFTKLVPYDMGVSALAGADDVVVERAERHIDFFATKPPYLPSPERAISGEVATKQGSTSVRLSTNGPYFVVEGTLDETCATDDDRVFVEVTADDGSRRAVEAFHVSEEGAVTRDFEGEAGQAEEPTIKGDWGYRAFVTMNEQGAKGFKEVRVLVGSTESACEVAHVRVG